MRPGSLFRRLAVVFATILLGVGGALAWLGYSAAKQHQHEVLQRVSLGLAMRIVEQGALRGDDRFDEARGDAVFGRVHAINPNIEAYVLDTQGRILDYFPRTQPLARDSVALDPIQRLLAGGVPPVLGDNPRHRDRRDAFSVAPIVGESGVTGYVYVILLSDMYRAMVAQAWQGHVLRNVGWISAVVLLVALVMGLAAFAWITRRLDRLTRQVEAFQCDAPTLLKPVGAARPAAVGDEIDRLARAFARMRERLDHQMAELKRQDVLRREMVANVSHDLRTPLTSMQGYLETLVRMQGTLSRDEQKQYLEIAVRQSRKVARLVQQLFELARLECEETLPQPEQFSIGELVQDIAQKFALTAQQKGVRLETRANAESAYVRGDIGMIERVISNLVDNAIRHTPRDGEIWLEARRIAREVEVRVADTGQGIALEHLPGLLERGSPLRIMASKHGGGLGLLIANRILILHGTRIHAMSRVGQGTTISFMLPTADAV
ncbi:MAG: ATP-binding protein [Luteimonas sp.]